MILAPLRGGAKILGFYLQHCVMFSMFLFAPMLTELAVDIV